MLTPVRSTETSRADNLAYMVFLDPAARQFYLDWDDVARDTARNLRANSVAFRDDPRVAEVVGELTIQSDAFTFVWMQHDVRPRTSGTKRFRHSQVGEMSLQYDNFAVGDAPGQQLLVYSGTRAVPTATGSHCWPGLLGTRRPNSHKNPNPFEETDIRYLTNSAV